jgi:uncharacterized protein YbcV (DUF1398 family)
MEAEIMDEQSLQEVYKQAAEKKWVYPQLFDALKNIGVERYEVDVLNYKITYIGDKTAVTHPAPEGFKPLTTGAFDAAAFKIALTRAQKQETTYPQFLTEIAAAGIVWYRVDMKPRVVTYHGKNKHDKIVEPVPAVSQ